MKDEKVCKIGNTSETCSSHVVSFSKDVCQVFISTPSQNGKWSAFRKQERKLFSMKELQLNDLLEI